MRTRAVGWVLGLILTVGCGGTVVGVSGSGGATDAGGSGETSTSGGAGNTSGGAGNTKGGAGNTKGGAGNTKGGAFGEGGATLAEGGAASVGGAAATPNVGSVLASPGCAKPPPMVQPRGSYVKYTTAVSGKTLDPQFSVSPHERDYYVWLPISYEPTKPTRITFLFMGCGDRNAASTATYKLMKQDPDSIYVAMNMPPVGYPPTGKDCYDVTVGKQSVEWEFMGLTASAVQKSFCVDENRLFVAGYSSGSTIANMFGCYFAGRDPSRQFGADISVRGQSGVTGIPVQPDVPCAGRVAAFWLHDSDDKENVIGGNSMVSLPRVLTFNGCTGGVAGKTAPFGSLESLSAVCKRYVDCPPEYPVVFCTTSGVGHSAQDALALPGFIEFQNLMSHK